MRRYNLHPYNNRSTPAIFFGLYKKNRAVEAVRRHRGLAILVWRGSDIMSYDKRQLIDLSTPNVRHVAISEFIEHDLDKVGLPYISIPIIGSNIGGLQPCPLGNEVYAYAPTEEGCDPYNNELVQRVAASCRFRVNVVTSPDQYSRDELIKLYSNSFIGLRLTSHDGIANQVIEMGLMGRRCIHNGHHPNAIRWRQYDDIMRIIEDEHIKIGQTNAAVSESVAAYVRIPDDWLNIDHWR